MRNVAELGEQLGYTEKHYKNVLSRFISWFNPEMKIVTEGLTADETARFLLRLHTPDTEEEKLALSHGIFVQNSESKVQKHVTLGARRQR